LNLGVTVCWNFINIYPKESWKNKQFLIWSNNTW
jgi:hypothetical protein